ncbi:hypothetical protein ACFQZ4_52355 [Catellatospora coxensis]
MTGSAAEHAAGVGEHGRGGQFGPGLEHLPEVAAVASGEVG